MAAVALPKDAGIGSEDMNGLTSMNSVLAGAVPTVDRVKGPTFSGAEAKEAVEPKLSKSAVKPGAPAAPVHVVRSLYVMTVAEATLALPSAARIIAWNQRFFVFMCPPLEYKRTD